MTAPSNDNRSAACPICQKAAAADFKPFCSRRCADVDLGRWLNGGYAIPAIEQPDEFELEEALDEALRKPDPGDV
jgi:endogenous inhibitor of DNA gyrase (YacG/DUF329 family)